MGSSGPWRTNFSVRNKQIAELRAEMEQVTQDKEKAIAEKTGGNGGGDIFPPAW